MRPSKNTGDLIPLDGFSSDVAVWLAHATGTRSRAPFAGTNQSSVKDIIACLNENDPKICYAHYHQ